jgi:hypothetical protein
MLVQPCLLIDSSIDEIQYCKIDTRFADFLHAIRLEAKKNVINRPHRSGCVQFLVR